MKYYNIIQEINAKNIDTISKQELYNLYNEVYHSDITLKSFENIVTYLKNQNIITNLSQDLYYINEKKTYLIKSDNDVNRIYDTIYKNYPEIKFTVFNTEVINEFTLHYATNNYIIVETEKISMELIIGLLKEEFLNEYTIITQEIFNKNRELFINNEKIIIVKPIVLKTPLKIIDDRQFPTIEKIMIDLYVDKLYIQYHGKELKTIYKNIFETYDINLKKLFSYAKLRTNLEEYKNYIKELNVINYLIVEE